MTHYTVHTRTRYGVYATVGIYAQRQDAMKALRARAESKRVNLRYYPDGEHVGISLHERINRNDFATLCSVLGVSPVQGVVFEETFLGPLARPVDYLHHPVFNRYPKFVVDFQAQEHARVQEEERELERKRAAMEAVQRRAVDLEREEREWRVYQERLLAAEAERRREAAAAARCDGRLSARACG